MITEELLKECRLEFKGYFKSLTGSREIQVKVDEIRTHSLRVVENCNQLARMILQTDEDMWLAELIALFHDLGKAEMMTAGTESPTNIQRDHSMVSVKLIQEMKFFEKLDDPEKLIVIKAIESHNKPKLPKFDSEHQTQYAKLLRDADKLDIFDSSYRFFKERSGIQPIMTFDLINSPEVSEKIIKSIMAGKNAVVEDMKTMNDYKLLLMSLVFDVNFKYTFRIISEKQYVQKIYETLPKRDQIIDAYRSLKLFVENKFVS